VPQPPAPARPPPSRYTYHPTIRPVAGNRAEAEPLFRNGVDDQREGRLNQAIESYRQAIRLDPAYYEAAYNLGVAATTAGNLILTLAAYKQALAINPTAVNARYNFGLALQKAHFPLDAAVELEKVLIDSPEDVRAHLALGNLYAQELSQNKMAGEHYRKVIELDPRHPQTEAIRFWLANNP
jgi:tetratricopeptide (TPR) repeat protein